jgi:hypothetical protein
MSDTARDYQTFEPATTEGLEDLFATGVKDLDQVQARSRTGADLIQDQVLEVVQDQIQEHSKMIPLSKAAEISGKARRYLLTLVHKGKLEGVKDQSGAWLVNLDQVQARSRSRVDVIQDQILEVVQDQIQDQILAPGFDAHTLFRELQAATFRNGYLESQIATYSEQVKLLPDLQAKANEVDDYKTMLEAKNAQLTELQAQIDQLKRGWWARFLPWFLGR